MAEEYFDLWVMCKDNWKKIHQIIRPGKGEIFLIGRFRRDSNSLLLNNQLVSRVHAQLVFFGGKFYIQDLGSTHGTAIILGDDEASIAEEEEVTSVILRELPLNQRFRVASVLLKLSVAETEQTDRPDESPTQTQH